jgi:hypothetical protein
VDRAKSEYGEMPAIADAYKKIWSHLQTDQIVWCYTQRKFPLTGETKEKTEWEIEVPLENVLSFIDGFVWAHIVKEGQRLRPPQLLYHHWIKQSIQLHPYDAAARRIFMDKMQADYDSQSPPTDGWWSRLFVPYSDTEGIDAIIAHPVKREWIKYEGQVRKL